MSVEKIIYFKLHLVLITYILLPSMDLNDPSDL